MTVFPIAKTQSELPYSDERQRILGLLHIRMEELSDARNRAEFSRQQTAFDERMDELETIIGFIERGR